MTDDASRSRPGEAKAMHAYVSQAGEHGHSAEIVDVTAFARLPEFGAAFLRLDTAVLGLSLAASHHAWCLGLRVVDDPRSIVTCMNKAHVQGLLERAGVATPQTVLLTRAGRRRLDADSLLAELGRPIVVKAPSGAFSSHVARAYDGQELAAHVRRFAAQSDVVLLQRYEQSSFDWRVVMLCGEPLLAARYLFPPGGWRVRDRAESGARLQWGGTQRVPLAQVPDVVMSAAARASEVIGTGLYGVDVKQTQDGRSIVIEVNDNPTIECGQELTETSSLFGTIIDRIARMGPRA